MTLNPIDLIVGSLIPVLGIKGALNGFRRELFGFVGLVGGIFAASRAAEPLAALVESHVLRLANPAAMRLIIFVAVLTLIWGGISLFGRLVENRSAEHPPSTFSRLAGFVLAAVKYFLVFAVIFSVLYRTPLIRNSLERHTAASRLSPLLLPAGSLLINLSPLPPAGRGTPQKGTPRHVGKH